MSEINFSIIVPVYNGQESIKKCIDSVKNLDYSDWELIIVNDGSTDNTKQICEHELSDTRIRLINKNNGGVSSSRNRGLQEAKGKYIIFLDADDFLMPDACSLFEDRLESCDFCIGAFIREYESGEREVTKLPYKNTTHYYSLDEVGEGFGELYNEGFINPPWAKCYKRELITCMFDESLCLGEDFIFNLLYMVNCEKIGFTNSPVYIYEVQSSGSLSSSYLKNGFEMLLKVYNDSLKLTSDLFENNQENVKASLEKKYVIDIINLLERNVRYNANFRGAGDVKKIMNKYVQGDFFKRVSLNNSAIKFRIEKSILQNGHYFLFCLFNRMLFYGKKVLRLIKKVEGR